jgi:glycosyltransferase involved in cell wall biosynthesis
MKIGVAIPCYINHIEHLFQLLDSIQNQTVLPNKVVVSCSSTSRFQHAKEYNFSLEIIVVKDKKNASQNRNIALSELTDMDYITFIDADDIMHPQRIEILLKAIEETNSDIILHNYFNDEKFDVTLFNKIENINIRSDSLMRCTSGCIRHINYYDNINDKIHHSQVTVKRIILDKVQFPEEAEFHRKEDCVFCHRVFSLPNIKNSYIQNELSYYKPSQTGGFQC